MLTGDQLCFRYQPGPWVIDHVSIAAHPGQVLGVRGPSGVGKSTLARLLTGHLSPNHGQVQLNGAPIPATGRHPVQLIGQHPEFALDPRWRLSRSLDEAGPRDHNLLDELFVDDDWLSRYPRELSGGELQRLTVARALANQPTAVVADEVSAMLDPITQAQLWQVLLRRVGEGMILVAISHDDALLDAVADEVVDLEAMQVPFARGASGG
ncbi:MAG: ATP-binding cassette domain-containing protein [Nitriliruptoraceae bacterium]